MEGFKPNVKMKSQLACYKEGGFVTKKELKREEKVEEKKDLAMDKAMAKKAVSQHESAKHKGEEKTELKLKGGRRVPKTKGTVNKYKAGGAVDTAEKGKPSAGKDPIKKVKAAPKKAATPSKAKTKKPEVPGTETGPSGNLSAMTAPPAAGPMATAPSAATAMPEMEGMQNMADGKRVRPRFFNEEPDDMTAVPTRPRKVMPKRVKPMPAPLGAASDVEASMMGPQDYGMSGAVSDAERQQIMDMFQGGPQGFAYGGMVPGSAGLGNAMDTGPLGAAAPMGSPRNVPMSPQETDVMRGLQAIGNYCKGGKAY